MSLIYFHNPRCSKSRAGLELLSSRDLEVDVRTYLDGVDATELTTVLEALDQPPMAAVRSKEAAFTASDLAPESSLAQVVQAIVAQPILLERPILFDGKRARIGRPTEKLLEILDDA